MQRCERNMTSPHGMEELETFCKLQQSRVVNDLDWIALHKLKVPLPTREGERIRVLRESQYLTLEHDDPAHIRLTKLAAKVFNATMAFISIVDVDKQWLRSRIGTSLKETHRNDAFCSYTILDETPDVMVVPDALQDERFKNNPLVIGPPYIRFYAGGSLMVEGVKLGSFCVIDLQPRHDFDRKQQASLHDMASIAAQIIAEQRRNVLQTEIEVVKFNMSILYSIKGSLAQLGTTFNELHTLKSPTQVITNEAQDKLILFEQEFNRFSCLMELAMKVAHKMLDLDQSGVRQMRMELCESNLLKERIQAALLHSKQPDCGVHVEISMAGFQHVFSHPDVAMLLVVSAIQYFLSRQQTVRSISVQSLDVRENLVIATDGLVNNVINVASMKIKRTSPHSPPFRAKNPLGKQFEKGFLQVSIEAEHLLVNANCANDTESQFRVLAIQSILSWVGGSVQVISGSGSVRLILKIPMLLSSSANSPNLSSDIKEASLRHYEADNQQRPTNKHPVDVRSICQQYVYSLFRHIVTFPKASMSIQPEEAHYPVVC